MIDTLEIPKEKTFVINEGCYQGHLTAVVPQIRNTRKGRETWIRLLFELDVPSLSRRKIPMAGRNFAMKLDRNSDLRNFLEPWLGREWFAENAGGKLQLSSLVGREVELVLEHYRTDEYEEPLVMVASASPPGSLQLTEKSDKEQGGGI